MVTPKTETKTAIEENSSSSFTAKNELVENFLQNSSKLPSEERLAFFEKYQKNETLKTSYGTKATIIGNTLFIFSSKNDKDFTAFTYDKNGDFKGMRKVTFIKGRDPVIESVDNSWAEKRGDSFIKDLQENNKPK